MADQPKETPREVQLAIGRLLRILSRPTQPGDDEQYEACRSIIMGAQKQD